MAEAEEKKSITGSKASGGKGGSVTKSIKEINRSPAGTNEVRIFMEQALKEERCRESFDARCHLFKKSRNPCNGELTARDDADFLIPLENTLNKLTQQEAFKEYERSRAVDTVNSTSADKYRTRAINSKDITLLQSMRKQRSNIDKELKQLKLIGGITNMEINARPF